MKLFTTNIRIFAHFDKIPVTRFVMFVVFCFFPSNKEGNCTIILCIKRDSRTPISLRQGELNNSNKNKIKYC